GQNFYLYDRHFEHAQFLAWLQTTLTKEAVDVLLISGDIFDNSNPSAASVQLFYQFLAEAVTANPQLSIIVTAGNHDSAARLEAPKWFVEHMRIFIIGTVVKNDIGEIDYQRLIVPLYQNKQLKAYCLAVPYLRLGDYNANESYGIAVSNFYQNGLAALSSINTNHLPVIVMGHLHCMAAELGADDATERSILGGLEFVPLTAFPTTVAYVALGHIHKAQKLGKLPEIRYSGSPLPMSFSEKKYQHQVLLVTVKPNSEVTVESCPIPIAVPLWRIPEKPALLNEVLLLLAQLPEGTINELSPFLEVNVLIDQPLPSLRNDVENAIINKSVRLVKLTAHYKQAEKNNEADTFLPENALQTLTPLQLLQNTYYKKYQSNLPESLVKLMQEVELSIEEQ
ncbi:MAG: exonuclease SbcCD subunit D, partial [Chitinophagaceae bacterium]